MSAIPILSDEWFELWVREAPGAQPGPGPSGSIEISLRRDDESRTFTAHYTDGVVTRVSGPDADADLRVELPEELWVSISEGNRAGLERAMLKGQLRISGDRSRLTDLGGWAWSDDALALMARIHAHTAY